MFCACFAHQQRNKVRRRQRTKRVLDVLPFKQNCHPAAQTSNVYICSVTARAGVFAMIMGPLPDDQVPGKTAQIISTRQNAVSIKTQYGTSINVQYKIMSNLPALVLRDQMPTSYLGREPSAIPTPATKVSLAPNLKSSAAKHTSLQPDNFFAGTGTSPATPAAAVLLLCECDWCGFLVYLYRPGRPKGPKSPFRKRPGHTANTPESLCMPAKS